MIQEVVTKKGAAAITSDQWYVVHSRLVDRLGDLPYVRGIHSEHADKVSCRKAAAALRARLQAENASVPVDERDEVFVRKPRFKTLKAARARRAAAE
jgi:hypothetical protein